MIMDIGISDNQHEDKSGIRASTLHAIEANHYSQDTLLTGHEYSEGKEWVGQELAFLGRTERVLLPCGSVANLKWIGFGRKSLQQHCRVPLVMTFVASCMQHALLDKEQSIGKGNSNN